MAMLTPRYPLHISERIISFLEFNGNYTRAELEMWAELNSYAYLKRKIAKTVSIVFYIGYWGPWDNMERYCRDETVKLLSQCTSSFFFLVRGGNFGTRDIDATKMDEDELEWLDTHCQRGFASGGLYIVDAAKFFGQLSPRNDLNVVVLYAFEFRRLMRQTQFRPESMYVITKWSTKKLAIKSLFCPPRLLPKGPLRDLEGLECLEPLAIAGSEFLGDSADNVYLKQGYFCKIESFLMRLLMLFEILMVLKDWGKSKYSKFPLP